MAPDRQGLDGVQVALARQEAHWPVALHTSPGPQVVPGGAMPVSTQTGDPEPHSMVAPVAQGFEEVQEAPCAHAAQTPVTEQTCPAPHVDPGGRSERSVHTAVPLAHSRVAEAVHGLADVQAAPWLQAMQDPPKQVSPVPHVAPSVTESPVSMQVETPVAQLVVPWWQVFTGVQASPAVQATQLPPLQTWPAPHVEPSATSVGGVVLSPQTGEPVLQVFAPRWQGLGGTQVAPVVQATHAPALHTRFVPQARPSETFASSTQTAAPVPHWTVPVLQGLAGAQGVPQAADLKSQLPEIWPRPLEEQSQVSAPREASSPEVSVLVQISAQPG
jgi:hypothetical protein